MPFPAPTRRDFLATALAATPGLYLGNSAFATAGRGKVRLALVGIGNRGSQTFPDFEKSGLAEFAAFCDLDPSQRGAPEIVAKYPDVPLYGDFRKMFDELDGSIDAVVVSTPDHAHFPITVDAIRRGKHVYCEKPLAHTFREIDLLIAAADEYGVVTQMGNQGHSGRNFTQARAWAEAGVFDGVDRVTAHMNKSRRWHPWGVVEAYPRESAPAGLDWDLWTMSRPERPYSGRLHPGNWRSWYDFGGGAFGDWGAHLLDTAHRFLGLGLPTRVEATFLDDANDPRDLIFPTASTVVMNFPTAGPRPDVELSWYDGVENAPADPLMSRGRPARVGKVWKDGEKVFKGGSHASPLTATYADGSRVDGLPDYEPYPHTHQVNFLRACLGLEPAHSPFSVGGPLCQTFLLGQLAQRYGGAFDFDPATRRVVGDRAGIANAYLDGPEPRAGWEDYYRV